jgi:hypothetical protein
MTRTLPRARQLGSQRTDSPREVVNDASSELSLRNDALLFQDVDLRSDASDAELTKVLKELNDRRRDLRESPPRHIPRKVYEKTKKSIANGESGYEDDPLYREPPA